MRKKVKKKIKNQKGRPFSAQLKEIAEKEMAN
jgi:hypothetical protein